LKKRREIGKLIHPRNINGHTEKKAENLLKKHGRNRIQEKKKRPILVLFLAQFKDTFVLILIGAILASAFMGESIEAFAIFVVVLMNGFFGFLQEYKTEKTLAALKKLSAPFCNVLRDGEVKRINSELLVLEDFVFLEAGDRVPADCVLISSEKYTCDESMLTGESDHVFKEGLFKVTELGQMKEDAIKAALNTTTKLNTKNKSVMGSMVLTGNALVMVTHTGMNTEMGKIAKMIDEVQLEENTLQKKLNILGKYIAIVCLSICALVAMIGILRGENFFDMLLSGISLAVASIPESLPAVVMVSLAVGVQRMLKKNALVKKLSAVETLGVANVICCDKTGTLTENSMNLKTLYFYDKEVKHFEHQDIVSKPFINKFFEIAVLCNNSDIVKKKEGCEESVFSGDSLEKAFMKAAEHAGVPIQKLRKEKVRQKEIPFDSEKKFMAVVVDGQDGRYLMVKGAPEVLLKHCSSIDSVKGKVHLTPYIYERILQYNDKLALKAYRVLGFAYKKLEDHGRYKREEVAFQSEELESDLVFVSLAGLTDPPRKDVAGSIKKIIKCGIRPVMITGDHKNTAISIAKETGIFVKGSEVVTGEELDHLSKKELNQKADRVSVFARVSPAHKLKIISLLKSRGFVVGMTGDGVNDAPAIKKADIGIAMGKNGTDVTREAASIVLLDDKFSSITDAVIEGRIIYSNIRKAILYLLTCNVGEVVTMLLGSILGFPIVLLPIQILWVNLVTDGLPAIGLACDVPDEKTLIEGKAYNSQNIFYDGLFKQIFLRGMIMGVMTLGVFAYYMASTGSIDSARTNAFITMIMIQLMFAVEVRGVRGNPHKFLISVFISFILAMIVLYVEFFQKAFGLVVPSLLDWGIMVGFCVVVAILFSLSRLGKKAP
jgi:P-type Ca2+ transporter type 2C